MIANLQAMFDKDEYEMGHALATNTIPVDVKESAMKNGDIIKMALLDKISSGKVGSLTVDPQFLDFQALECKQAIFANRIELLFLIIYYSSFYSLIFAR